MANDPNHPESWLETSATGMLIYGLARGVNEGWLDAGFANNSRQGWKALQAKVTPDGDLLDVCGDRAPATEQAPNEKLLKVNHYQKNPGSLSRKQKKRGQFTQRGKSLCTKRLKNMKSTTAPHDVSPVSLKDHCNPTRVISGLVFLAVLTLAFDVAQASDQIELVAGGGAAVEGRPATECKLSQPFGIAFDPQDNMFICEETNRLLRVDAKTGILTIVTEARPKADLGNDGPVALTSFNAPHNLVADNQGNLFIADSFHFAVRRVDAKTGVVTLFAGTGVKELTGDGGPAAKAGLDGVACLSFNHDYSKLYLGGFSKVLRVVDMKTGIISTVPGMAASRSQAVDSKGNLYNATRQGVRMLGVDGKLVVLEDASAQPPMTTAKHMSVDRDDNILIADEGNHLIRKFIVGEKKLITIAGTGAKGLAGIPGPALQAQLNAPHGVSVHPRTGDIYIADSRSHRVLRIKASSK